MGNCAPTSHYIKKKVHLHTSIPSTARRLLENNHRTIISPSTELVHI